MKHKNEIIIFLTSLVLMNLERLTASFEIVESEAQVKVLSRRRVRRSADSGDGVGARGYEYDIEVGALGVAHQLKLRPAGSLFSPNFRYNEVVGTDEFGNTLFKDVTPSRNELAALEASIFVDGETSSAVRVENWNGEYYLNGIVNDVKIRRGRQDSAHAIIHRNITKRALRAPVSTDKNVKYLKPDPGDRNKKDYIDLPPTRAQLEPRTELRFRTGPLSIQPELHFVIEYRLAEAIGDEAKILEYMAILLNSVNAKYELTKDVIDVKHIFIGLTVFKSAEDQPFVESNKQGDKFNLRNILQSYMTWAGKAENMAKLGHFDIAPLQLNVEFTEDGLRGLAIRSGSCKFDSNGLQNSATPCSQDLHGIYVGTFTTAHEIGHSLGSPHDGEKGLTADCPWNDGYIMSYLGWGTLNKWKFSSCSLREIRKHISSQAGKCLFESTGLPVKGSSAKFPGEIVDNVKICAIQAGSDFTVKYQSPDDHCRNTKCERAKGPGTTETVTTNNPPGNGAPCGAGGKCRNGYCLKQGPPITLDEICLKVSGKENAKYDPPDFGLNPTYDVCSHREILCMYPISNGKMSTKPKADGVVVVGTKCSKFGVDDGVCYANVCTPKNKIPQPHGRCRLHTGKMDADQVPTDDCTKGTKCMYADNEEYTESVDGDPCLLKGSEPGTCKKNKCVADEKIGFKAGAGGSSDDGPWTLEDACAHLKAGTRPAPENTPETSCSKLKCEAQSEDDPHVVATNNTPDGTICGALKRCKGGKCMPCS